MNLGQACRPCRGSCSPIPGRGCFGDLPGDEIVVFPPSPIVEPLDLLWDLFYRNFESEFSKSSDPPAEPKLESKLWPNSDPSSGLDNLSELHLELVGPHFEEIQGRQGGRQQTLALRNCRRCPTELGYRRECPPYRPLPVLSLSLSIWSGSAFRDVAASKTADRCQVRTPYNKKMHRTAASLILKSQRPCAGEAGL